MGTPEIWFAIPSASPERCRAVLPLWREKGYKVAVLQNVEKAEIPADLTVWSDTYPGWSESINILTTRIVPKSADIVVSGGCDMLPDPNFTAQELAEQFMERFADSPGGTFGVMQPHGDEFANARHYCGSPFLGRSWIDSMYGGKGPMFGEYRHNWGDVELYWVSKCYGALWERPDLTHFHKHFNREGAGKPKWWVNNVERHDKHDVELFISRSWTRFPGHEPVGVHRTFDPGPLARDTVRLAEKHHMACYGPHSGKAIFESTMQKTLEQCAKNGQRSVAIYGSGTHTRNLAAVLLDPPVEINCVIDDDAQRQGRTMWGFPIVSKKQAIERGVQAVILSANAHEGRLWDNSGEFFERGIPVIRLYGPPAEEKNARVRKALDACAIKGQQRVALYGAGGHTKELDSCLRNAPVDVVCVIDDNAALVGQSAAGLPVHTMRQALGEKIDAVILSSDRFEDAMWEQTRALREAKIEVVRLYAHPAALSRRAQPVAA